MNARSRAAALLIFGGLVAPVANATRPSPMPWVLDYSKSTSDNPEAAKSNAISLADVKQHFLNYTAQFIDAREADQFAQGHLRGAYNLPSTEIERHLQWVFENLSFSQLIIIYCDGGNCEASDRVFENLRSNRFTHLRIFKEGWEALGPSDLPQETGPWTPPPVPGAPPDPSQIDPSQSIPPPSDPSADPNAPALREGGPQ